MLAFCLLNLSGLPFFFGFLIKHFLFLSFDFFFLNFVSFGFIFLAAFCGIFYSFKIFYYVFFDTKKARSSVYFSYTEDATASIKYSSVTIAGSAAILFLAFFASLTVFYFFICLHILKTDTLSEVSLYFGKAVVFQVFNFDLSTLFNFKVLNTVICIFFFFLNFFKWNSVFATSFEFFFFILLLVMLLAF
jgi:hypothetical protein